MEQPLSKNIILLQADGKVWTTSLDVANHFDKRHDNVLQAIQKLDCSPEFRLLNFQESGYLNEQGKQQPCVRMTRDGYSFLAYSFTGKRAAIWKEKYIAAFNAMEEQLRVVMSEDSLWIRPLLERQGRLQETLTNGLLALNVSGAETTHKVEQATAKLTEVDKRVTSLETRLPKKRREIAKKTKDLHAFVLMQRGNSCPCCIKTCDRGVEYDHFYSNQHPDFEHTWPLCIGCHDKLTRGLMSRLDAKCAFDAYQEFAKRIVPKTSSLFD